MLVSLIAKPHQVFVFLIPDLVAVFVYSVANLKTLQQIALKICKCFEEY